MKKQLLKKYYAFIIPIAIGMMFSSAVTNAQVVYTDMNPDILLNCSGNNLCSEEYSLDLNDDGISDFILATNKLSNSCGRCTANGILVIGPVYSAEISATAQSWIADTVGGYALNTLIDSSLGWTNDSHILAKASRDCVPCVRGNYFVDVPPRGPWSNIFGKYLALKTQVGTDFYYGWIKLGVGINISFVTITIMEYAYNSIPNQPILAGQTLTTRVIENSIASSINLFPIPADNHLTIDFGSYNEEVKVTIADITGKVVYTTVATDTRSVEVNTNDLPAGIYVAQIQAADFISTKKFAIEK